MVWKGAREEAGRPVKSCSCSQNKAQEMHEVVGMKTIVFLGPNPLSHQVYSTELHMATLFQWHNSYLLEELKRTELLIKPQI